MQKETSILLSNLVALVSTITMCLSGWCLKQVHTLSIETAKLSIIVSDGKDNRLSYQKINDAAHEKMLASLTTMIPRTEFEMRIKILDDRIKILDDRIRTIEERSKTIDERTRLIEERARLIEEKVNLIEVKVRK